MVKLLTASPISASDEPFLFVPSTGPEAAPPLYPANSLTRNLVGASEVSGIPGTYPGPAEYPGADVYPGRGTDLIGTPASPKTLIGVAA